MAKLYGVFMIGLIGFTWLILSCVDFNTKVATFKSYGNDHVVKVYSGGQQIAEYVSQGKPESPQNSDGYLFMNKKTMKLVEVSGTVIMEAQ